MEWHMMLEAVSMLTVNTVKTVSWLALAILGNVS